MKSEVGLWIDHRETIVVFIRDGVRGDEANRIGRGEACAVLGR
jgi:hypothetical protein